MRFCRSWVQAFVLVGLSGCGGHPSDGAAGGVATPEPASPVPASSTAPGSRAPSASGLVVHEWGTFTAMQGVDGLAVDGLQHEGDALPASSMQRPRRRRRARIAFGATSASTSRRAT